MLILLSRKDLAVKLGLYRRSVPLPNNPGAHSPGLFELPWNNMKKAGVTNATSGWA